ncbi:hypothetical protein [Micromonospora sp. DT233]|uniref:hypothetical protein n=1 Tax=Micromonospora sp. DT233 TaxID=3393432 RepID=UPI003CEB8A9B
MSSTPQHRSSHDAAVPSDVTDLLLWRLAYDVAAAHQPDESGRCPNLLCNHQPAPCEALTNAERAMALASGGTDAAARQPHSQQQPMQRSTAAPAQPGQDTGTERRATRQAA